LLVSKAPFVRVNEAFITANAQSVAGNVSLAALFSLQLLTRLFQG
jgi:hypothetical protein